jgi:hypothetical protein
MKSRKPIKYVGIALGLTLGSSVAFPACVGYSTCEDHGKSCGNGANGGAAAGFGGETAGGDSSGGTGNGGASGNAATGGSGTAGAGGHGGGATAGGGSAGLSGAPACDGDCKGSTPVCDEATNTCVQCLEKADCESPKPACDAATNTCVECTATTDCKDSSKPFCDPAAQQCIACLKQADCTGATASACNAGVCKACTVDAECSNIAGKGVCDAGTCVQCTGQKFTACGQDGGTPLVCDSLKRTCTTSKQQSVGLCQACVSDAQCTAGKLCVLDKFGSPAKDVGYFCHWKKGDTTNGAPADCFAAGKPYAGTQVNAASIDGVMNDVCVLRTSTCVARNQFSSKDCAVASAASDAACGFAPGEDAKCIQVPSSTSFSCTMTCLSSLDCPGTNATCDTGASPPVCSFN